MPTNTFVNLDSAKKKRFIEVCLHEFAAKSYHGASVSFMVKELMIAKGSVYQYFESKEELYEYLVEYSLETKQELLNRAKLDSTYLAEWLFSYFVVEIKFARAFSDMSTLLSDSRNALAQTIRNEEIKFIKSSLKGRVDYSTYSSMTSLADVIYAVRKEVSLLALLESEEAVINQADLFVKIILKK